MSKSKNLPKNVITVRTYSELAKFAKAFGDGHLNFLFLVGDPGLGKSRHVREAIGPTVCWIDGTISPIGIYMDAYRHRDEPIVLDDVDGLYRDRAGIRLLKSLCQTDRLKNVAWHTQAPALDREGVPRKFTTSSHVIIIANQWKSLNADVAALEDRGHIVNFEPANVEIHQQAGNWFWDQQIFDFVAENLHLVERHSLRIYGQAWELKQAGMDWQGAVLSRCLTGVTLEVAKLKADPSFSTEEDRVRAFVAAGLGCRANYFNHAKKIRSTDPVPQIMLLHTEPPLPSPSTSDLLSFLRKRFGQLGNG